MERRVTTGTILRESFQVFQHGFVSLLLLSLVLYTPVFLISGVLLPEMIIEQPRQIGGLWLGLSVLAVVVFANIASAALVRTVFRLLRGNPPDLLQSVRTGLRRWLPLLLAAVFSGLLVLVGLAFCIIPGLIAASGLYVAIPALIVERKGPLDCLHRSWDLTDRYKLSIFGVVFLLSLLGWGLQQIEVLLFSELAQQGVGNLLWLLISGGVDLVLFALQAAATTVAYHQLRTIKEGVGEEELLAVFD